jgi:thymidylate synthase
MTLSFKNANNALPGLLHRVLTKGDVVDSRNGMTKELAMQHITLTDPWPLEITTPGRKVSLPAQIAETMWVLAGRNDIEWLSHYLPRAGEFSDDGQTWRGGYGPRIRKWLGIDQDNGKFKDIDQLAHVVDLLKMDSSTRRAVLNIYDPSIDTLTGKDIPCNNWVHFLHRDGKLNAHVAIRSNDLMWGWSGINSFEWAALLTVVAGLTGLQRGSLTFSISSLHLYEHHWEKAHNIVEEMAFEDFPEWDVPNPEFSLDGTGLPHFDTLVNAWFEVENLIRTDAPEAEVLNSINSFPEAMLRSWLWVLYAWHNNDMDVLSMVGLEGSSLYEAAVQSPKRKRPEPPAPAPPMDREGFTTYATTLHADKHEVYGNSWKRRGEMLGIMANIARKVDRLGVAGGGDTSADTAVDLLVYLVKYRLWLEEERLHREIGSEAVSYTEGAEHVARVDAGLQKLELDGPTLDNLPNELLIQEATKMFDKLEHLVADKREDRVDRVGDLIQLTYPLAVRLWTAEQP